MICANNTLVLPNLLTSKHCQQYDLPLCWSVFNSMNLPYIITSPAQQNEDITYTNYITITLNYVNRKWEKKLRTVLCSSHWYLCLQVCFALTPSKLSQARYYSYHIYYFTQIKATQFFFVFFPDKNYLLYMCLMHLSMSSPT